MAPLFDLTLYLITDSTPAVLGDRNLLHVVEEAIRGGVTIVQYRDKHADTEVMIKTARRLHRITRKYRIPLVISDRVDVAMVVDADGVHLDQDDMHLSEARAILGDKSIIGVSACNMEEAENAFQHGADYLTLGTMFSKLDAAETMSIIGTVGARAMLDQIDVQGVDIPAIAIGGINASNVQRMLHQASTLTARLSGIAVMSAVMASIDPQSSARELRTLMSAASSKIYSPISPNAQAIESLSTMVSNILRVIRKHTATNHSCLSTAHAMAQEFAANVCFAVGSSLTILRNGTEASDLAACNGALVINVGGITPDTLPDNLVALEMYNCAAQPVVLYLGSGGATSLRPATIKSLTSAGFFDVIYGNEDEIGAVIGGNSASLEDHPASAKPNQHPHQQQQREDAFAPDNAAAEGKARLAARLAVRERCIVLLTGDVAYYLSDGRRTLAISNGHPFMSKVAGSCDALGSVLASYLTVEKDDKLLAVLTGLLVFAVAAETAVEGGLVSGPGSFVPAFLDQLYIISHPDDAAADGSGGTTNWLEGRSKVKAVDGFH